MKRLLSISLLLCFIISLAGYFPAFLVLKHTARQEIKYRIKQGVRDSELHKIVFASNEKPDWVRKGKEFWYKNQLYDIVSKEINGEDIVYYCVNDTQETQLFVNLEKLVKKQMEDENSPVGSSAKTMMKFFSLLFIAEKSLMVYHADIPTENHFFYQFSVIAVCFEVETPPPVLG